MRRLSKPNSTSPASCYSEQSARNKSFKQLEGAGGILVFGFARSAVFSPRQDWLHFDGGLGISFGDTERPISHRVRAPK